MKFVPIFLINEINRHLIRTKDYVRFSIKTFSRVLIAVNLGKIVSYFTQQLIWNV